MQHNKKFQHQVQPRITSLEDWLTQQAHKDTIRLVICGDTGTGKSTLIDRLVGDLCEIPDGQSANLAANLRQSGRKKNKIDFSPHTDNKTSEHEENTAINVAYRLLLTSRRKFIVADAPSGENCTHDLMSGASTADSAIILIDASQGLTTSTKRHAYLVSLLGIRHIAIAINKMDAVHFSQTVASDLENAFRTWSAEMQFTSITAIPMSALSDENVTTQSRQLPWYDGPTLLSHLETIPPPRHIDTDFAFPVQLCSRYGQDFSGLSGTVASGSVSVGDSVRVTASGQTAKISNILTADGNLLRANAGDAITLVLDKEISTSRGDVIAAAHSPLEITDQFEATIIWMSEDPGLIGRNYNLKLATQNVSATITGIKHQVDVDNGTREPSRQLRLNDIAICNLALSQPVTFDRYLSSHALGSFILIDRFNQNTIAAGLINHSLRRSQNIHRQALSITREDRETQNGHRGQVIWFTGLSGSGKSTIANALEQKLHSIGKHTYILDGDNIRHGLNKDLGFTDADRVENIRRVAEVAKLMMDAGLIVITAFISPFRAERDMAKQLIGERHFTEIYINTPLEICEQRDPKGLYKKARKGLIPNMTGINSPYEAPDAPDFIIDTDTISIQKTTEKLTTYIASR